VVGPAPVRESKSNRLDESVASNARRRARARLRAWRPASRSIRPDGRPGASSLTWVLFTTGCAQAVRATGYACRAVREEGDGVVSPGPTDHDLRIEVLPASLVQSQSGAITGEISLCFGSHRFPGDGWNDFVVIVLSWWCESCATLLRRAERQEFWFMDGPFLFTADPIATTMWSVRFWQLRGSAPPHLVDMAGVPGLPNSVQVPAMTFARSLVDNADSVLDECRRRGWMTTESQSLGRLNDAVRDLLGS